MFRVDAIAVAADVAEFRARSERPAFLSDAATSRRFVALPPVSTRFEEGRKKVIASAHRPAISFQAALLAFVAIALLVTIVPSGLLLEGWLKRELELRAWRDASLAPEILRDRNRAINDALMMHAKDVAHAANLGSALSAGDRGTAQRMAVDAARALGHSAILVSSDGSVWMGPPPPAVLVDATKLGEMPVSVISDSASSYLISLAPVLQSATWVGAAGVVSPLDSASAAVLASLTRSDFVILMPAAGQAIFSRSDDVVRQVAAVVSGNVADSATREVRAAGGRFLVSTGPLAGATVAFVRDLRPVLAILPQLRVVLVFGCIGALGIALLLSSRLAPLMVRPVRSLADAADQLAEGRFDAPLEQSSVREIIRVRDAFDSMRTALASRIEELRTANKMLEERQSRLSSLQSELIRRERVAASGRIVAELAHEIRNPVANLRNCLELLHRRLDGDPEGQEFATLAIDELLRMHELAEQMLHLNRPHRGDAEYCDATAVAREVVTLVRLAQGGKPLSVDIRSSGDCRAAIPPDALKQVLLNLVQNARDAVAGDALLDISVDGRDEHVSISVRDNGPGVPAAIRERIFDPFFTTRETAGGVGLGLFVVEGVVRGYGGRVWLDDDAGRGGACFRIDIPVATGSDASDGTLIPAEHGRG